MQSPHRRTAPIPPVSDYSNTITDCNSISDAEITLRHGALNIKYGRTAQASPLSQLAHSHALGGEATDSTPCRTAALSGTRLVVPETSRRSCLDEARSGRLQPRVVANGSRLSAILPTTKRASRSWRRSSRTSRTCPPERGARRGEAGDRYAGCLRARYRDACGIPRTASSRRLGGATVPRHSHASGWFFAGRAHARWSRGTKGYAVPRTPSDVWPICSVSRGKHTALRVSRELPNCRRSKHGRTSLARDWRGHRARARWQWGRSLLAVEGLSGPEGCLPA